ncbi:hypothetical protein Dshi_3235 [Dinoroseobacter shibae DFL 12 = DSM 16493]|jgi:hypothetical protein|uniref:Uncharacterized protein n=1 Tax=Dinoroseobacter shibae (strain DSM 16493 / NCIMB 14021 / DFL 12) TaxID=398580 RepID=A8LMP3_DINSH|nr:hypothetical protein [Dinoroseobacter shibae]ABV94968.1 hypothetical protein Dshi_3235 [Dinoroseobacter shibae DFL 12 = DSM 16493]URF46387.1 hypothetical protein M8008_16635 [Dinoroseobacter shibae]URF50693.1 hypothetical protein M8007_16635 [Dinoroseobacter shibae]
MLRQTASIQHKLSGEPNVVVLRPHEPVVLDQDRVVELFVDLGEIGAQSTVSETLTDIRDRVGLLPIEFARGTWDGLEGLAQEIMALARSIGFVSCEHAARQVAACARGHKANDMPPVIARLDRVCAMPGPKAWGSAEVLN